MGNIPSFSDNGVTVSRRSTWSTTSTGEGPPITEHTESVTEYGVTHERSSTSSAPWQRSNVRGDFSQRAAPSAPASETAFARTTTTDACPRPDLTGDLPACGGKSQGEPPSAPAACESEADTRMDEGGGYDMLHDLKDKHCWKETGEGLPAENSQPPLGEKGTPPPSGVCPPDQDNPMPVEDKRRTPPQPSSRDEKDPPPPYTPGAPPEYSEHEKVTSPPESVPMEADPRENPDQQQGFNPNPSQSDMDPVAPSPSESGSGNILSRFFGKPKTAAKIERDTVYKTKNIETARAMMKCDEESEKRMMDITQAMLNDLTEK